MDLHTKVTIHLFIRVHKMVERSRVIYTFKIVKIIKQRKNNV